MVSRKKETSVCSRALRGWALCAALVVSTAAHAQTGGGPELKASLSETGVWDSNPMMRSRNVEEIFGAVTTPRLSFTDKAQTSKIGVDAWIENSIFNRSEYNTTDYHARIDFSKSTQRLLVGLKADGDYDTTRTSELTNFGMQTDLSRHFSYALTPTVAYDLSQVSRAEMTGTFQKATYKGRTYYDYHTISLAPSYLRNFTELYTGSFTLNARRYETDEGVKKIVDSMGPSVGILAKLTPKFSAQFRIGAEQTQEKVAGVITQKWTWNTVFGADVTYKGDQDTAVFSASRAQQSYGNGNNALLTSFEAKEDRRINQNLGVNVGGVYQFSGKDNASSTNLDTRYGGNVGLSYRLAPYLDMSTTYRYRHEDYVNTSAQAEENVARVGLSFKPTIGF